MSYGQKSGESYWRFRCKKLKKSQISRKSTPTGNTTTKKVCLPITSCLRSKLTVYHSSKSTKISTSFSLEMIILEIRTILVKELSWKDQRRTKCAWCSEHWSSGVKSVNSMVKIVALHMELDSCASFKDLSPSHTTRKTASGSWLESSVLSQDSSLWKVVSSIVTSIPVCDMRWRPSKQWCNRIYRKFMKSSKSTVSL